MSPPRRPVRTPYHEHVGLYKSEVDRDYERISSYYSSDGNLSFDTRSFNLYTDTHYRRGLTPNPTSVSSSWSSIFPPETQDPSNPVPEVTTFPVYRLYPFGRVVILILIPHLPFVYSISTSKDPQYLPYTHRWFLYI